MNESDIENLPGKYVRLIEMDDIDALPSGTTGRVTSVIKLFDGWQIDVDWSIPRALMLLWPEDKFEIIEKHTTIRNQTIETS